MGYTETLEQGLRRDELARQGLTCSNATNAGPLCRMKAKRRITVTISEPDRDDPIAPHDITLQYCGTHWKQLGRTLAAAGNHNLKDNTITTRAHGQVCIYKLDTIEYLG